MNRIQALLVLSLVFVERPAAGEQASPEQVWSDCESGSADACLALSRRLRDEASTTMRRRACELGSAEACVLQIVIPRPVDSGRFSKISSLCRGGDLHACGWAGLLLRAGEGTKRDDRAAVPLLERACQGDVVVGCSQLARIYAEGYSPRSVAPDVARSELFWGKALERHRRRCESGDALSCFEVAKHYRRGWGVPRDHGQRWSYLRRACDMELGSACLQIADGHWRGASGIEPDFQRAAPLLIRACHFGSVRACRQGPQLVVDFMIEHPGTTWTDRASLEVFLRFSKRELAMSACRPESVHAAIGAVHLLSGRPEKARAAFEAGLGAIGEESMDNEGVRAPYVFGKALSFDALRAEPEARAEYTRFIELTYGIGSRPWLMLPRAQGIRPTAALQHARDRIATLAP